MAEHPNYYRILGVSPFASDKEIQQAYRALAKRYHPDTMPLERQEWARKQMARINVAYKFLQDPQKRARYDQEHKYTTLPPPDTAVWRRPRTRERSRRLQEARWRTTAMLALVLLVLGLVIAAFLARAQAERIFAILLNGG